MSIWENGQKARWPRDADFVAAFDLAFSTLPSTGRPRAERVLELPLRRGAAHQLARQRQAAGGGDDHRLNAVADRDLELAVVVLQLGDLDRRLALAADVDERDLRADRDDRALDGLAALDALRFDRRLEHRGEIFFLWIAHARIIRGRTRSSPGRDRHLKLTAVVGDVVVVGAEIQQAARRHANRRLIADPERQPVVDAADQRSRQRVRQRRAADELVVRRARDAGRSAGLPVKWISPLDEKCSTSPWFTRMPVGVH